MEGCSPDSSDRRVLIVGATNRPEVPLFMQCWTLDVIQCCVQQLTVTAPSAALTAIVSRGCNSVAKPHIVSCTAVAGA